MKTNRTVIITVSLLILSNLANGLFVEETVWYFLAGHGTSTDGNLLFGRGFFLLLAPSYLFLAPFLSDLSDKIGRKKVLLLSSILLLAAYLVGILAYQNLSMTLRMLSHLLFGAGFAFWAVLCATLFDLSRGNQRLRYTVYIAVIMNVFFFTGAFVNHTFKFLHENGLMVLYVSLGVQLLCTIIVMWLYQEPSKGFEKRAQNPYFALFSERLARYFISPKLRTAYTLTFISFLSWSLYSQSIRHIGTSNASGIVLSHYGFNMVYCYSALTIGTFLILILNRLYTSSRRIFLIGIACTFIGVIGEISLQNFYAHLAALTLSNVGFGILTISIYFIANASNPRFYGLSTGLLAVMFALVSIFANIMISTLASFFQTETSHVMIMTLILLLMIVLYFIAHKKLRD